MKNRILLAGVTLLGALALWSCSPKAGGDESGAGAEAGGRGSTQTSSREAPVDPKSLQGRCMRQTGASADICACVQRGAEELDGYLIYSSDDLFADRSGRGYDETKEKEIVGAEKRGVLGCEQLREGNERSHVVWRKHCRSGGNSEAACECFWNHVTTAMTPDAFRLFRLAIENDPAYVTSSYMEAAPESNAAMGIEITRGVALCGIKNGR